jgi:tagatose-1,6-bisphosphate aldolase non-catalytic subunit AgaZ/GatZ
LLHIDTTVNRELPPGQPPDIDWVVDRTVELIVHCEAERKRLGSQPFYYEVGTEEVHGGLVDMSNFSHFLNRLRSELVTRNLLDVWPCFIVGKVGTDLQTTFFAPDVARELTGLVTPLGSVVKGHYTDWVENPEGYPATGMGAANIGPEFTTAEYLALVDLEAREADMLSARPGTTPSGIAQALEDAVVASGRWQKWLQTEEKGRDFKQLSAERRAWLVQTGARYIWTDAGVLAARQRLNQNLSAVLPDPNQFVVERIAQAMENYITHFHLFDSVALLS